MSLCKRIELDIEHSFVRAAKAPAGFITPERVLMWECALH